jgi:ribosomal protein L37AE/L43A
MTRNKLGNVLRRLGARTQSGQAHAARLRGDRPCCPTCDYRLLRVAAYWLCSNCRIRTAAVEISTGMIKA